MDRSLVVGGTGRLGRAVVERLRARGDQVFSAGRAFDCIPEALNYIVFCQRYRGPDDFCGEWRASVELTNAVLEKAGFSEIGDCGVVIVSSITGVEADAEHPAWYQCAKAAQVHLARHWGKKLGVRVNCVCPDAFTGPRIAVEMSDVADAIVRLCEPGAGGGQTIVLTGKGHGAQSIRAA